MIRNRFLWIEVWGISLCVSIQKVAHDVFGYPFQADMTKGGAALTRGEIAEGSLRAIKTY
jgi:hypothetical protein